MTAGPLRLVVEDGRIRRRTEDDEAAAMAARRRAADAVRNPLLALPSVRELEDLDPETRRLLRAILTDLRRDARERADKAWRTNKGPMAAYWKAVAVYAGHLARALR